MTIMAAAAVPHQHRLDQEATAPLDQVCPSWCVLHMGDGPAYTHLSNDTVIVATSDPERAEIFVSIEHASGASVAVRVQGAGDAPMSPAQALHLAAALELAARQAMS